MKGPGGTGESVKWHALRSSSGRATQNLLVKKLLTLFTMEQAD